MLISMIITVLARLKILLQSSEASEGHGRLYTTQWLVVVNCESAKLASQISAPLGFLVRKLDYRLSIADCRLQIANCKLRIANCRLPIVDCKLQIANCRSSLVWIRMNGGMRFWQLQIRSAAHGCIYANAILCLPPRLATTDRPVLGGMDERAHRVG